MEPLCPREDRLGECTLASLVLSCRGHVGVTQAMGGRIYAADPEIRDCGDQEGLSLLRNDCLLPVALPLFFALPWALPFNFR